MPDTNSVPLTPGRNKQMVPAPAAPARQTAQPPASAPDHMDAMFPEIYHELHPVIADTVNEMIAAGYQITQDTIGMVVDNIIKNSGLWNEDDDDDDNFNMFPPVVPLQFGRGRAPYRRRRRGYHNRNSLRDIVRILLLQELFGRGYGFPYSYY